MAAGCAGARWLSDFPNSADGVIEYAARAIVVALTPRNSTIEQCRLWVLCHEYRRSKRRHTTVLEMEVGPPGSAIRSRSQATASGCGQMPWS